MTSSLMIHEGEHYSCEMKNLPEEIEAIKYKALMSLPLRGLGTLAIFVFMSGCHCYLVWKQERGEKSGIMAIEDNSSPSFETLTNCRCSWEVKDFVLGKCSKPQKAQRIGKCSCLFLQMSSWVKEESVQFKVLSSLQGYLLEVMVNVWTSNQNWTVKAVCRTSNIHKYCSHTNGAGAPCINSTETLYHTLCGRK